MTTYPKYILKDENHLFITFAEGCEPEYSGSLSPRDGHMPVCSDDDEDNVIELSKREFMVLCAKPAKKKDSMKETEEYTGIKKIGSLDVSSLLLNNDLASKEEMVELFSNGSVFGKMVEVFVKNKFSSLKKPDQEQLTWDLEGLALGEKIEVRCWTKNGCNLIPSNMIGKGRKYDDLLFKKKLEHITGYIIVDIRELQSATIPLYWVEANIVYRIFGQKLSALGKKQIEQEGRNYNEDEKTYVRQVLHETERSFPAHLFG